MANSGSFNTTGYEGRYLQFAWSIPDGGQSISENKTKINWTLTGKGTAQAGYYLSGNFKVVIDGTTVFQSADRIQLRDGTLVASGSVTLAHNSDGTRSFSASAEAGIYTYAVNCSGSGSWSLPTIARASSISSAGNVTLGNKCSVKWTPKHKSFGYKLEFSLGSWSYTTGAIVPGTTAAYTYTGYTIPLSAANQIPNSKTGTMTVKLYSYTSSTCVTQIGSEDSDTFTVTVPSSAAPTVSMELSLVTSLPSPFNSLYLQGKSKVQADFSGSSAKYGASVTARSLTVSGNKVSSSPYQSEWLITSGSIEVKGTVTDSRGYSSSIIKNITVIPYSRPKVVPKSGLSSIVCKRCNSDGTLSSKGTSLLIKAGKKFSKVTSGGEQKNYCSLSYRIKASSDAVFPETWTSLLSRTSTSNYIENIVAEAVPSVSLSYTVQIKAEDDVGEKHIVSIIVPAVNVPLHLGEGGRNIGIGQFCNYASNDRADFGFKTYFNKGVGRQVIFEAESGGWPEGTLLSNVFPNADISNVMNYTLFIAVLKTTEGTAGNIHPVLCVRESSCIYGSLVMSLLDTDSTGAISIYIRYTDSENSLELKRCRLMNHVPGGAHGDLIVLDENGTSDKLMITALYALI